jgi:hypothetical protein
MPRKGERPEQFRCAANGSKQCTGRSKQSGRQCRNYACVGRRTCRMHGGTSKRGSEHCNYRNGLHSKDLKDAFDTLHRALQVPIRTVIAVYPDSIAVGKNVFPAGRPRRIVEVSFPDNPGLPILVQMRALREANKQISADLRILRVAKKQVHAQLHEMNEIVERECCA